MCPSLRGVSPAREDERRHPPAARATHRPPAPPAGSGPGLAPRQRPRRTPAPRTREGSVRTLSASEVMGKQGKQTLATRIPNLGLPARHLATSPVPGCLRVVIATQDPAPASARRGGCLRRCLRKRETAEKQSQQSLGGDLMGFNHSIGSEAIETKNVSSDRSHGTRHYIGRGASARRPATLRRRWPSAHLPLPGVSSRARRRRCRRSWASLP